MKQRFPAHSKDAAKCDFFLLHFYQKGVIVIIQTYHSRIAGQNFSKETVLFAGYTRENALLFHMPSHGLACIETGILYVSTFHRLK